MAVREGSSASFQQSAPRKSRQYAAEESRPTRRASTATSKSQWGGSHRVVKRQSSRNLSKNQVDLIAAAAGSQAARPKLQTVEEYRPQAVKQGRSSSALVVHSSKTFRDHVSSNRLGEMSVPELVDTVMDLRRENEALKTGPPTAGEHSINRDISARDSAQWNKQKQALEDAIDQLRKAKRKPMRNSKFGRPRSRKPLEAKTKY